VDEREFEAPSNGVITAVNLHYSMEQKIRENGRFPREKCHFANRRFFGKMLPHHQIPVDESRIFSIACAG
jgi:hypothetical protein